jgi:hypothetical protein
MKIFYYLLLIIVFLNCQGSNKQYINEYGTVELIILEGTMQEKQIQFKKNAVIKNIVVENQNLKIQLTNWFCNEVNNMNLGASYFKLKFFDSSNNLELILYSFSKHSSIMIKQNLVKRHIEFDQNSKSYFPNHIIEVGLKDI